MESFKLVDSGGQEIYLADYGCYIGKEDSGMWEEILTPAIENYSDKAHGMHGEYFFGQVFQPKKFPIKCFAMNVDETNKRNIQHALSFSKPKKLIFDRMPYKYLWIIPNGGIDWKYVWNGDYYNALWDFTVVAFDPLWYSVFDSLGIAGYVEDVADYPKTLFFDSGILFEEDNVPSMYTNITENAVVQIYNGGSYEADCKITIQGSGENIVFTNLNTQQNFTIESLDDDVVVIDSKRGIITNTTETELKTSLFDGDFMKIESGDNTIQITGTNLNLESVIFNFRYTYL